MSYPLLDQYPFQLHWESVQYVSRLVNFYLSASQDRQFQHITFYLTNFGASELNYIGCFPTLSLWLILDATNGPKWRWKLPFLVYGTEWNFSIPNYNPCGGWQGVTCNSNCKLSACNVIKLQLNNYEMDGPVTSSLSSLTSLTTLAFVSNKGLRGVIPPEL
eukprot:gene19062-13755_t